MVSCRRFDRKSGYRAVSRVSLLSDNSCIPLLTCETRRIILFYHIMISLDSTGEMYSVVFANLSLTTSTGWCHHRFQGCHASHNQGLVNFCLFSVGYGCCVVDMQATCRADDDFLSWAGCCLPSTHPPTCAG